MTERSLSATEISDLLTGRLESLVPHLFPAARRQGPEFCVGSITGEPGQSLRINVSNGPRRGLIKDFSSGVGYDALKLVAEARFGGDYGRAIPWAKSWLGLDDADPARIQQERARADQAAKRREAESARETAAKRRKAEAKWLDARPLERGDPVDRYLLSRAIDLHALGHAPGALRYHPALEYWAERENGRYELRATLPAMVARIVGLDGRFIGTHCTWLKPDGSGKAGEAELGRDPSGAVCKAKKVNGGFRGGHIKLWLGRDASGKRVQGSLRAMKGEQLLLSEGIEDGLTAAVADPSLAVAVMVSVGNMQVIELPDQARRIVMLKQNDPPGSSADQAFRKGVAVLREQGRRVLEVPIGGEHKDINDLARAGQAG